jgi:uncharacterized membrane protein HdeD (DUF308 family)
MAERTSSSRARADWLLLFAGLVSAVLGLWLASRPGAMWGVWIIVGIGTVAAATAVWWLAHSTRS